MLAEFEFDCVANFLFYGMNLQQILRSIQTLENSYFLNYSRHYLRMLVSLILVLVATLGESSSEIVARLKRDLVPTIVSGLMYWPICDFITFKFVPVHLQVCSRSHQFLRLLYTIQDVFSSPQRLIQDINSTDSNFVLQCSSAIVHSDLIFVTPILVIFRIYIYALSKKMLVQLNQLIIHSIPFIYLWVLYPLSLPKAKLWFRSLNSQYIHVFEKVTNQVFITTSTASCEQYIFICMECIPDLCGKPTESLNGMIYTKHV